MIARLKFRSGFFLSNEAVLSLSQISQQFAADYAVNEGKDNWVQLAPYGDFPNVGTIGGRQVQVVQRFQKEDADRIISVYNSVLNTLQRVRGIPFYIGHPDDPSLRSRYNDTKSYGRIQTLQARTDGLYGNVTWNSKGKELINDAAFDGHSVHWSVVMDKGSNVCRPTMLKSVGFTNEPNLPVTPITVANEKHDMKELLIKLLALANEATEQQIVDAVTKVKTDGEAAVLKLSNVEPKLVEVTGQLATVTGKAATAEAALVVANGQVATLTNTVTTHTTALANEKALKVKAIADIAVASGKITGADRVAVEAVLSNEATFAQEVTRLGTLKAIKTAPVIGADRGKGGASGVGETISALVNEARSKNSGLSYDDAWAKVRREKPDLFVKEQ